MPTHEISVHLFDFDGTLTKKSTVAPFFMESCRVSRANLKWMELVSSAVKYKVGRTNFASTLKSSTDIILRGAFEHELVRAGDRVAQKLIDRDLIWPSTFGALKIALAKGERVAIVTGGYGYVARSWLRLVGLSCHVFSSRVVVRADGAILGCGEVCVGRDKLKAIEWARDNGSIVHAYGNSSGDFNMLAASDRSFWVDGRGRIDERAPASFG